MMLRATLLMWLMMPVLATAATASDTTVRQRLERGNAGLAQAWQAEDGAAVRGRYRDDAMLMPEHAHARVGADAIARYYRTWFGDTDTLHFARRIHDVLEFGPHAVEVGTFEHRFARTGVAPFDYAGKYLVVWDVSGADPAVLAELWSADAGFDAASLPARAKGEPLDLAPFAQDSPVAHQLRERNARIRTLVMQRDGATHAALFLPDAIYLPYYTPMQVGSEAIRGYFIEHEQPGPVSIDALDLHSARIHPLDGGRLQLEEGFYRVAWRAGDDGGTVHGKSLNLWQRGDDGAWMLLRQAVNHD